MPQRDPSEQDEPEAHFHRDRREHGGAPGHLDEDQLARLTEEERVEAGLDDYDPDEVPPATAAPPAADVTETEAYQWERAGPRKRAGEGELTTRGDRDAFPPSHYDEQ
jgi:hypothetical protein